MKIFKNKLRVLLPIIFSLLSQCVKCVPNNINLDKSIKKSVPKEQEFNVSKNVTRVLNQLLRGYDKRIRPNYSGAPVTVGITININNINSVSEVNMDYSLDIFFRQLWIDKRLKFDLSADGINELVIGSDMLHKIWLPDTFIANDKRTYFHKATVQNKFIRINPDGQVLYSMRMTVTASCPMNFRYFPMDHQVCDLEIESYGFRMDDIKYKWGDGLKNASALDISPDIELPQLKYKDSRLIEREFRLSTGTYSRLTMKLYFVRSLGYYIIQIYIPSTLIVVLSWVSFWLDISAAPARITLGMTTVLTMVTFIWSTNASLPKISYIKGIDVYLVMCFVMTFSSVIEYAIVSFIYNRAARKKKESAAASAPTPSFLTLPSTQSQQIVVMHNSTKPGFNASSLSLKCLDKPEDYDPHHRNHIKREDISNNKSLPIMVEKRSFYNDCQNQTVEKQTLIPPVLKKSSSAHIKCDQQSQGFYCQCNNVVKSIDPGSASRQSNIPYKISVPPKHTTEYTQRKILCCMVEMRAETIDKYSRAIFPIVFTTFHVLYWTVYLTISSTLWYMDALK